MNRIDKTIESTKKFASLENLYLDPNNFRLIHELEQVEVDDDRIKDKNVMKRTLRLLSGDKNIHIQDLIDSFKANGYLPVDQIQVREIDSVNYVVIEGNRRIAALKFLSSEYDSKGIDLGNLNPSIFSEVPIVIYADADEIHHLTLMGLKHVSGNKKWGEWNEAKLLEKLNKTHKLSEDEICKRIGISKIELRRSLRALSLVEQYKDSDYGDQFNESKFPIFKETVRNDALKRWLNWDDTKYKAKDMVNLNIFFSWISQEPKEEETDDEQISFGKRLEPAIIRRDDVRTLGKLVNDIKAIEQLKISRDLNSAYRVSDLVFNERQDAAIKSVTREVDTLEQMAIQGKNLPELENSLGRLQSVIDRTKASGFSGVEQKTVFHDRIDQHFTELDLCHYKKLDRLKITKIARINLFTGLNNSGKTTLLEAIYLLSRQNDFGGLSEVIRRRGKVSEDRLNPEWFSQQLPESYELKGTFDNQKCSVTMNSSLEENKEFDKASYLRSVELTSMFGNTQQESLTRIFLGRNRETQASSIKLLCPAVFSSPFFLNEPHRYASFYHKSTQSKALGEIFTFIQQDVVPSISDIRLVDEWQRFLVTDSDCESALDLMEYGEGLQRIFFVSLLFASAQNGIVLIDEFENAIHTELIGKFCQFIHKLSKLFNVQVFLTSHSKECIDAFIENIPDVDVNDFAFHTLVCQENAIVAREFTGHEFQKLLEAGDVDLRRAR